MRGAGVRVALAVITACAAPTLLAGERPALRDPVDGWPDLSAFLDTAYGFVPLLIPITEPAVGYGAVAALLFIDRKPSVAGQSFVRPNIAAAAVLATENGTRGAAAAHLGSWRDGRVRTNVAIADADVNLEFFGLGQRGTAVEYTVSARGGQAGGSYRIDERPLWVGLRYARVDTRVTFAAGDGPAAAAADTDLELGGLVPSLTVDTRDNYFTPTRGWYLDASFPVFRDSFGGERDFEIATLQAQYFRPLANDVFFGVRAAAKDSSDDTPFFLRPFVALRGVQALRYQGEAVLEAEAEVRWQFHSRFSVVAFGGAGEARSKTARGERTHDGVVAGGAGVRYFVARTYGLHMGVDVAWGPDDPVLYVVFGTPWLRP